MSWASVGSTADSIENGSSTVAGAVVNTYSEISADSAGKMANNA